MSRRFNEANLAKGIKKWGKVGAQVWLEEDTWEELRTACLVERCSISEMIRTYIEWGLESREEEG